MFEENVFGKYEDFKDNLAELLLLREDLIAIRDDLSFDDKYKIKLLYKKNIEYLVTTKKNIERDIMELFRAREILNFLRFKDEFINFNQIRLKIENERYLSKFYREKNTLNREIRDLNFLEDAKKEDFTKNISDETFKDIAKEISPNINKNITEEEKKLWKETLKAKSDNSFERLKDILDDVNKEKKQNKDFFSLDMINIEKNLNILNNEIQEITKVCKENFNKKDIEKLQKVIDKIEIKRKELIYSINSLNNIKKDLMEGFLGSLPPNRKRIFN